MNSRQLMLENMEGRATSVIPVAPYFWGAEYIWKVVGEPIWQVMYGERNWLEIVEMVDRAHDCDWILPLPHPNRFLVGKKVIDENSEKVWFQETETGKRWVFDKHGHNLSRVEEEQKPRTQEPPEEVPTTRQAADEWLLRRDPNLDKPRKPHPPDRTLRERFPDRFLVGGVHPPFAALAYGLGFEETLELLHHDPSLCAYMIERLMAGVPDQCTYLGASGYDAGLMCDSWASTDIISPKAYKSWVAPFHRACSDELHRAGTKSIIYETGNVLPLLEDFVEMGYDAISIEERIKGLEMDIGEVRRIVGQNVCLFGNFDSYLLRDGDKQKIKDEVARQVESAANGAPFIMGTGSPVCDAMEPEIFDYWISEVRAARD